ncbi:MAG: nucleotidyltransferase domain-containing protein [Candidatus Mariimomonas ferrooxydans]
MIRFRELPEDIHIKVSKLSDFFNKDSNIVFAYLFGGLLKDRQSPLSDVDIAVFVENIKKLNYLNFFNSATNVLGTDEVDLIILNTSPLSLTGRILQNRRIIIDKNPFLRHRFESDVLRKFFDFRIKERDILKRRYGIG